MFLLLFWFVLLSCFCFNIHTETRALNRLLVSPKLHSIEEDISLCHTQQKACSAKMNQTRASFQIVAAEHMGAFAQVAGVRCPCEGGSSGNAIVLTQCRSVMAHRQGQLSLGPASERTGLSFELSQPFPNQPLVIGGAQKGQLFVRDLVTPARV